MSTRDTWVFSATFISYIMYPTLVRFPFELMQCRMIDGIAYLERDLEERCYQPGSRHFWFMTMVAVPALLVYAVGFPVGSFLYLKSKQHRLSSNKMRFRLGLLYSGYRHDRWWWEIIVATRKVTVISLASFGFNEHLQVHLVLGVMILLLVIHFIFLPYDIMSYEGSLLHRVERNSLLCLIVMLWAGVVFNMGANNLCTSTLCIVMYNILIVLVVLVNCMLLVYGTYLFVYFFLKRNHMFEKLEKLKIISTSVLMKRIVSSVSVADEENSVFDSDEEEKEKEEKFHSAKKNGKSGGSEMIREIQMTSNPSLKPRNTVKQPAGYGDIIFNKSGSEATINPLHHEL
jgi:hypothetical protein